MNSFGQELRAARSSADLTLRDLSRKLGVSIAYLSYLEHDEARPSSDLCDRIRSEFAGRLDASRASALEVAIAGVLDRKMVRWLRTRPDVVRALRRKMGAP